MKAARHREAMWPHARHRARRPGNARHRRQTGYDRPPPREKHVRKTRHEFDLIRVTAHGDAIATGDHVSANQALERTKDAVAGAQNTRGINSSGTVSLIFEASMDLPARMDQAGIIDTDDSNIEQARGCKSTGIVKTGMMERTER